MPRVQPKFGAFHVSRRDYFICAALLVLITILLPITFLFTGGPAGWLLLFMARVRDVRNNVWAWPALVLVGAEMFGKDAVRYVASQYNAATVGYMMIALVVVHACFAIALGVQRSGPTAGATQ